MFGLTKIKHPARCTSRPLPGSKVQAKCGKKAPKIEPARKNPPKTSIRRRHTLLSSFFYPILGVVSGSDDTTTVLNSVLSAYGLPTLKASKGYKLYDEFEDDFFFEYPRSWVVRPNSLRKGVYISDFQTADKATLEIFPSDSIPENQSNAQMDFVRGVVAKFVAPRTSMQDDRLELPPDQKIQFQNEVFDGQDYVYLEFPSSTITRSGYQVKRKNVAVAAVRKDTVYALCTSTRSERATPEKEIMLRHVVESFRLR